MQLLMKKEIHCSKDKMYESLDNVINRFKMLDRRFQMYQEHLEECFYFSVVSGLISMTGIDLSLKALVINSVYNDSNKIINAGLFALIAIGMGTIFHNVKRYFGECKPHGLHGEEFYQWLESNYKLPEEIK